MRISELSKTKSGESCSDLERSNHVDMLSIKRMINARYIRVCSNVFEMPTEKIIDQQIPVTSSSEPIEKKQSVLNFIIAC